MRETGTLGAGEGNCRTPNPQQQGQVRAAARAWAHRGAGGGGYHLGGGGVVAPDPRAYIRVVRLYALMLAWVHALLVGPPWPLRPRGCRISLSTRNDDGNSTGIARTSKTECSRLAGARVMLAASTGTAVTPAI